MQYNYSHDDAENGSLLTQFMTARTFEHNVIRYNISENDGRLYNAAGLLAYAQTPIIDTSYYNNTVFVSPSATGTPAGVRVLPYSVYEGLNFWNNILYTTGGVPLIDAPNMPGVYFAGNLYWSGGGPVPIQWGGHAIQPGRGGMVGNPLYLRCLNAYRLRPGSPAINAALDLPRLFDTDPGQHDFFGEPKSGLAWDVGAAEFQP